MIEFEIIFFILIYVIVIIYILWRLFKYFSVIKISIFIFSLITLISFILNLLFYKNLITYKINILIYFSTTILNLVIIELTVIDIGINLYGKKVYFRKTLLNFGILSIFVSIIILIIQCILVFKIKQIYYKPLFITGTIMSMIGSSIIYIYSFIPFLYQRYPNNKIDNRVKKMGVWYLSLLSLWYLLYSIIYIWFFTLKDWNNINVYIMLNLDYFFRMLLCIIYLTPPLEIFKKTNSSLKKIITNIKKDEKSKFNEILHNRYLFGIFREEDMNRFNYDALFWYEYLKVNDETISNKKQSLENIMDKFIKEDSIYELNVPKLQIVYKKFENSKEIKYITNDVIDDIFSSILDNVYQNMYFNYLIHTNKEIFRIFENFK